MEFAHRAALDGWCSLLALFTLPLWGSDYMLAMACIVGIHVIATLGLNITTGNAGLISLSHGAFLGRGLLHRGLPRQDGRALLHHAAARRHCVTAGCWACWWACPACG